MSPYLITVISIAAFVTGQLLVTRKQWTGFLIWAASNLLVVVGCLIRGDPPTALMFLAYLIANVYSMLIWARQSKEPSEPAGRACSEPSARVRTRLGKGIPDTIATSA